MPFFKSASSIRSDSSELDLEGLAEAELAKLQRQYRLLETNRHAYTLESREIIHRQMAELKRLQKENEDLLRRKAVAETGSNLKQEKDKSDTLRSLLGQRDEVEKQIIKEKQQIALLDKEIQTWKKRLEDQKQVVGSGTLLQEQKNQLQRRIQTAENQLEKASSEFNSQLVLNSQLREDLVLLRIQHDRFEQLYKHLETDLQDTRKAVRAVVSTSSAAYEARDEAQSRLNQLQDKAEKDRKQHETELKELDRLLENDRRVSEFIAIKFQERSLTEEALRARQKKEEELRYKDPDEEQLETYDFVFHKIMQLTGTEELSAALNNYIQVEDRNFAHFNYVNEQNNQKEQLLEQIKELRHEIEEVQKKNSKIEAERLSRLKEVETQQEEAAQEANRMEIKLKSTYKIWEQLKNEIESLFGKLQCDRSALESILGGTTTARNENVAIYLSLIEQKTNELVAIYAFLLTEEQDQPHGSVEIAQMVLGQTFDKWPQPVHMRPPTAGVGHDPIAEEDQRPLSHEELKEKVVKDIDSKAAALVLRKNTQPEGVARSGSIGTKKHRPSST